MRARNDRAYRGKDILSKAFARLRAEAFPGDERTLMDLRRSGAMEAVAGDVDATALETKMANKISGRTELQKTYLPAQATVVEKADAARRRGRAAMRTVKP